MSYTKLLYHIVICTQHRTLSINLDHERELYGFIQGLCKNRNVVLYRIGGMPDHVHLLVGLPSTLPVAKFVQEIKAISSLWLKNNANFPLFTYWSKEYAAFSYSAKDKEMIINYIKNQKKHHINQTFIDEYRRFLMVNDVDIDERFFLID